ncbi:MAG: hypothetical protein R6X28_12930 [Bacteroidales bacterium]
MKKKLILILITILFSTLSIYSQCDVKINRRPDGSVVKYQNPEFVSKGTNFELGLSVSKTGDDYIINTFVRYFIPSKKQIDNLMIQLDSEYSVSLPLYTSELATMKGENIGLGLYLSNESDIQLLKKYPIKRIIFKEADGTNQIVTLTTNKDVVMRQIKCLE